MCGCAERKPAAPGGAAPRITSSASFDAAAGVTAAPQAPLNRPAAGYGFGVLVLAVVVGVLIARAIRG